MAIIRTECRFLSFIILFKIILNAEGARLQRIPRTDLLPNAQGKGPWDLLWEDDFDVFDPSKWNYQLYDGCQYGIDTCGWGNDELVSNLWMQ